MSMLCWLADDSDSKHMEIVVQWQQQVSIELLTYLQGCLTYACLALDEIEDRLGLVLLRDLPQPNGCLSIDVACNLFRTAVDWHIEYCARKLDITHETTATKMSGPERKSAQDVWLLDVWDPWPAFGTQDLLAPGTLKTNCLTNAELHPACRSGRLFHQKTSATLHPSRKYWCQSWECGNTSARQSLPARKISLSLIPARKISLSLID